MRKKNLVALLLLGMVLTNQVFPDEQNSPREVILKITGDFPKREFIDPEVVTLSGKDARDHLFLPGCNGKQNYFSILGSENSVFHDDITYYIIINK